MNNKDFAIGVLSVTAVVLFAALMIVQTAAPHQAMAFGQNATAGDYVVSTSQLDDNTELLEIVDSVSQRMNVYGMITTTGQIELIQTIDLKTLLRGGADRKK